MRHVLFDKAWEEALMAKIDVKAFYRNILIHPDGRFLLGMKWRKRYFVDLVLPFGFRSAPYIYITRVGSWLRVAPFSDGLLTSFVIFATVATPFALARMLVGSFTDGYRFSSSGQAFPSSCLLRSPRTPRSRCLIGRS